MHRIAKFGLWKRGNKYGAKKTEFNGQRYDSGLEAKVAAELELRKKAGEYTEIQRQVDIPLMVNGVKVATYRADFIVTHQDGRQEVIEAKGMILPIFSLKWRILEATRPDLKLTMVRR